VSRWIAFDDDTASALAAADPSHTASVARQPGDPLQKALGAGEGVVILPSLEKGQALVLDIRRSAALTRPEASAPPSASAAASVDASRPAQPVGYRAGGFLGLSDEPVFEDETPPQGKEKKKRWWQAGF